MPSMGWADGMGVVPVWGSSPALDMASGSDTPQNKFLLVATGEFGHCLSTFAAHRLRGDESTQEAFLLERRPETLVRHALLMAIALDNNITLRERSEIFLETYGNTFLSERGWRYVQMRCAALEKVFIGDDTDSPLARALDTSLLKHKELDQLREVAALWAKGMQFETAEFWDERLRQYYQSRYDSRKNIADWDYHMKLQKLGAEVVAKRDFINWRLTGMAFEFGDKAYTKPNFTLGCYAAGREKGRSVERHGYWGDVITGPYISYGIKASREALFAKRQNEYKHTATDISKYNVTKLLAALLDGVQVEPTVFQSGFGGDHSETTGDDDSQPPDHNKQIDSFPAAKIVLMLGEPQQLLRRQRYNQLFDGAYISCCSAGEDLSIVGNTLTAGGLLVLETAKFVLDFRIENKTEFLRRLYDVATQAQMFGLLPMRENAHQGKGAARTGDATSHVQLLKAGGEGPNTISFPEIDPLKKEEQEPAKEPAAPSQEEPASGAAAEAAQIKLREEPQWQVVQRHGTRSSSRPKELVVRVHLPMLDSISKLDLQVNPNQVVVTHADPDVNYEINLQFPVDKDKGKATFESEKHILCLELPVCEPEE